MRLRVVAEKGIYGGLVNEQSLLLAQPEEFGHPGMFPAAIHSTGYTYQAHGVNGSQAYEFALMKRLPETHSVLSIDSGGTGTWANDTAIAAIDAAVAWSESKGRHGPFLLSGLSMGFSDLMAWARTHQDKVAGAIGWIPVANLSAMRASNRSGFAASIDAAYGGAYSAAVHGPTHDPVQYAASLGFPIIIFSAADDAICLPSEHAAFVAAAPHATLVNLGNSGGHNPASVTAAVARPEFATFLDQVT